MKGLRDALKLVRDLSKQVGISADKGLEFAVAYEEATETERSTKDERLATMDALRSMVKNNPDGVFDPRQVVVHLGLKQCQADRAFVRSRIEKIRLEFKPTAQAAE